MTPIPQTILLTGTSGGAGSPFTTLAAALTEMNVRVLSTLPYGSIVSNITLDQLYGTVAAATNLFDISVAYNYSGAGITPAQTYFMVGSSNTTGLSTAFTSINTALAAEILAQQGTPGIPPNYIGINMCGIDTNETGDLAHYTYSAICMYQLNNIALLP